MGAFDYLAVLISIILGLAIAEILQGYRDLAFARERTTFFWPTAIWSLLLLLLCTETWWSMFGLRSVKAWGFAEFSVVLLQTVFVYLLAALVLPDFAGEGRVDLGDHYFKHRRLFFGALVALLAVSISKDVVISGHLPGLMNLGFQVLFAAVAGIAILTGRRWYHQLLAPVSLVVFLVYIGALFARLP